MGTKSYLWYFLNDLLIKVQCVFEHKHVRIYGQPELTHTDKKIDILILFLAVKPHGGENEEKERFKNWFEIV